MLRKLICGGLIVSGLFLFVPETVGLVSSLTGSSSLEGNVAALQDGAMRAVTGLEQYSWMADTTDLKSIISGDLSDIPRLIEKYVAKTVQFWGFATKMLGDALNFFN